MDASKGKVINRGGSAILPRNNVVYLERRGVKCRWQIGSIHSVIALVAKLGG